MYSKIIWIAFIAMAASPADGKKTKRKNNNDALESTPAPNVLTYSTFGFNDVGSFEGYVPSSPDTTYLNNNKQESQMRLYAPAFPSSIDSTGLGSYYDPQEDNPSLNSGNDGQNVKSYQPVATNFFTSHGYNSINEKKNTGTKDTVELNNDNPNYPIYGTKLSSKLRNKAPNDFNNTEYNILDSVSSVIETNYNNDYSSSLASANIQSLEGQNNFRFQSPSSSVSFPKVIDFTSAKKYYPTSVESKYATQKPINLDMFQTGGSNENSHPEDNKNANDHQSYKNQNPFSGKDVSDLNQKQLSQGSFLSTSDTYANENNNFRVNKYKPEYKDKVRIKHEYFSNNNDDSKILKNPIKGYEYSTNHSTTSFQYDFGKSKPIFNSSIDEILPESSNLNLVNYRFPDKDFSGFKSLPNIKPFSVENDDTISSNTHDTYKPSEEYLEAFKDYYSGNPTTASHWGNIFKTTGFSSFKKHPKKPYYNDEDNDDIVHIPKRPLSLTHEKYSDAPDTAEWPYSNRYKSKKPSNTKHSEWSKDFINNKFKTEEDLLGLRNQDGLSSSYLPTFKYNYDDLAKDFDYNKLSERWRQSYLKSKNKDHGYETHSSETKAVHVPRPKPYAVRVPVVKPYPVHVPQVRPVFHHKKPHDDDEEEDEYEARPDTRRPVYKRHKNPRRPRPTTRRPTRMVYRENKRRYPVRRPYNQKRPRRPSHAIDQTPSRYHEDFEEESDSDFIRYCKRSGKC